VDNLFEIGDAVRQGKVSSVELTEDSLKRIEKLGPAVNAFITVSGEAARKAAQAAEKEIRSGHWRGPLHGIPYGLKDLIDTAGIPTTAASSFYKYRVTMQSAAVVQRLNDAGAILLGKQNLHEFAYGGSTMISAFGEVRNPWNPARIAGGSSSGSAAAVALGMGHWAIGTDTAGSIREPAGLCGVVGLKPTFGRVSLEGIIPLSPSLDHAGPITRCVADAVAVLAVIADPAGGKRQDAPSDWAEELGRDCRELRVGIPRRFFFEELDEEVANAVEEAIAVLSALVGEVREIVLEVDTDRTVSTGEAYLWHAAKIQEFPELYCPETLRRIRAGEEITAEALAAARTALQKMRREISDRFADVDLLVTPTTPIPAPSIAELQADPDQLRPRELVLLRNTRPFNAWGLPAISVPCGFTRDGMPIGLQIAGPPWREDLVLRLAHAYEQAAAWHKYEPGVLMKRDGASPVSTGGFD
jgi:aspartyl-tRNA(Asn)/glutamyl-tRNA(Gln) amidotransferase subunit A